MTAEFKICSEIYLDLSSAFAFRFMPESFALLIGDFENFSANSFCSIARTCSSSRGNFQELENC